MSLLAAPVVSLLFFSAFGSAAISSPDCSTSWEWVRMSFLECIVLRLPDLMTFGVQSFNSLGQNACTVAAYMMSTCNGGCKSVAVLVLR